MPTLDSRLAASLDSLQDASDHDEDDLLDSLDDDASLGAYREQRLQQMHAELARSKQLRDSGNGSYHELKEETALMHATTANRLCVVHFCKPDFNRCRIMDGHLQTLARAHVETRVVRIDVENAPFLVVKLKVQVLPCVIAFVDGISVDRIVGFEGLPRGDDFTTQQLEHRLVLAGVFERVKAARATTQTSQRQSGLRRTTAAQDSDEDDWD